MNKIEKFDLYLTQLILNTKNNKKDNIEVNIGRINEYLTYIDNNPLSIKISKNSNDFFECKTVLDGQSKFEIQYIHRIYQTPYYVSYLSNNDFNIKILDFYEWDPQTSIYRLFIFKKVNFDSIKRTIKLNFEFNNDFKRSAENEILINEIKINFSAKNYVDSKKIKTELLTNSDTFAFACVLDFDNNIISSFTLDFVLNKFHELYDKSKSSHISKWFITKNLNAEKELDELWYRQKFILPDLKIDDSLRNSGTKLSVIKFWIKDFYDYFNIKNNLSDQSKYIISNEKKEFISIDLLKYLTSKSEILYYYLHSDFIDEKVKNKIQDWWDIYSLPLFENVFGTKCINDPEEVFAVYFLAIRFKLPWASLLLEQIENSIHSTEKCPLHNFLLLLSFLYKRIIKKNTNNNISFYSPGYYWDNNFKSLIDYNSTQKYENTRFSNNAYTKISINDSNSLKINKLCRIYIEGKNKNIIIYPLLNGGINNFKIKEHLKISIDDYTINFPLIWKQGYFEFKYLKLKWLLKKSRFQFTLHSSENKTIYLNDEPLNLTKEKKSIFYIELSQDSPKFYLSLFNKTGGTQFSQIGQEVNQIIVSGFAITKYGTITDNILFSKNIRKQKLFSNNLISNDVSVVQLDKNLSRFNFYIKHSSQSLRVSYIENHFTDRFIHLSYINRRRLLVIIDHKLSNSIKTILMFFEENFGFKPEYFLQNENSKSISKSNLIIEFKYQKDTLEGEKCYFEGRNLLLLRGNEIRALLEDLRNLLMNNIVNYKN